MTHYEVLGVAPDATLDEIRRAFRKASSAAHPDKAGGSDAAMARVNAAHDTLSDPERRKRYDETGEDRKIETLEDSARELLLQILAQAIEADGDPIAFARRVLLKNAARTQSDKADAETKLTRLARRRAQVTTASGINYFHGLIDQQIATIGSQIPQMVRFAQVLQRAGELLDTHEYIAPPHDAPRSATVLTLC